MTRHSAIVGGSSAGRLIECPGSWQATMALPPTADTSSEYALEGSAMHAAMDALMRSRMVAPAHGIDMFDTAEKLIGAQFYDRKITREHLDEMILPALSALSDLEQLYGSGFHVLAVEAPVRFPGIPGAFGTVDLILGNATRTLHVDWKFGQGVGVAAFYLDSSGVRLNPQLMFYTVAARNSLKSLYQKRPDTVIAIVQPRAAEPLTHTLVTKKELKWFAEDLEKAITAALEREPELHRGEHCRWCPAKIACPLWTGPMLDLAAMGVLPPRTELVTKGPTPYGDYLAKAKELVDMLALYGKEVNEQLHAYLEDGGEVPGWRLKAKAKQRQWIEDHFVAAKLTELGFPHADIWQRKLQTFAATDAAAKRLGVKIPPELRVAPPTNETTVCRTDDPAPPVERSTAIEQFRASIPLLNGKG